MRANGPVERFTAIEIGERDGWLCGICRDLDRPVPRPAATSGGTAPDASALPADSLIADNVDISELISTARDPLAASVDHIVAIAAGGTHSRDNVRISHLFCNMHKNNSRPDGPFSRPEYMRAVLANLIDGTPVSEEIHRSCFASWAYPSTRQVEYMIALYIAAGEVAADPRFGDPTSRVSQFAQDLGEERWQAAVSDMVRRRTSWRNRWRADP